jgi:hypothetical protein
MHALSQMDPHFLRLHVGIKGVMIFVDLKDNVISQTGFEGERASRSGNVLWDIVHEFYDRAVGNGQNLSAIRKETPVLPAVTAPDVSIRVNPIPVDGEALRVASSSIHRHHCPTVLTVVRRSAQS